MLYYWCVLFIWNGTSVLANLIRNQGNWNLMILISIVVTGISLGEILHYYKK